MFYIVISKLKWAFYKFFIMPFIKMSFKSCGHNVVIGRYFDVSNIRRVSIGNNTSIGSRAIFLCSRADIEIGSYVMTGPNVTIITGDHRLDIKGKKMIEVKDKDKLPENDQPVIIEDDVWLGANVTILKGVTIGEGSVVDAGAVVCNNIEPYSIYAGVPAKLIKRRF